MELFYNVYMVKNNGSPMQVLQQWMRVARSSPAAAAVMEEEEEETFPRPYSPTTIVDDDYSEDYVPPQPKAKVKAKPREKKPPPAKKVATAAAVKVIDLTFSQFC